MLSSYLSLIGFKTEEFPENSQLNTFVSEVLDLEFPTPSASEVEKLYSYAVPQLSPDGSCSIGTASAKDPYNLTHLFAFPDDSWEYLRSHPNTEQLWRLNRLVEKLYHLSGADWLGVYQKGINPDGRSVLVKLAYQGAFSRAEFPLTAEFAANSNNSTVGLRGKAIVVQDVGAYQGPYYVCDGKVQSEFCLPILNRENELIGIIDAESFQKNFFTPQRLLEIAKVSMDLGESVLIPLD